MYNTDKNQKPEKNILLYFFHIFVIIFFATLPLYPAKYMYIIRWLPLALIVNWFVFEGCPLTKIDPSINDQDFLHYLLKPFLKLSTKRLDYLTYIYLFIVFFFCNKAYYEKSIV